MAPAKVGSSIDIIPWPSVIVGPYVMVGGTVCTNDGAKVGAVEFKSNWSEATWLGEIEGASLGISDEELDRLPAAPRSIGVREGASDMTTVEALGVLKGKEVETFRAVGTGEEEETATGTDENDGKVVGEGTPDNIVDGRPVGGTEGDSV
jgi:hypothetical protein